MSAKYESRMDIPGAQALTNFFHADLDKNMNDKKVLARVEEFWIWAKADSDESRTCFECGIESLLEDKEDFKDFWISITNAVSDGKFPELKKHIGKFVWSAVEMDQDDWA